MTILIDINLFYSLNLLKFEMISTEMINITTNIK